MIIPLSWLKDYVDIDLPLDEIARLLTMAGMEVEEIHLVGLAGPEKDEPQEFKFTGLAWDPDKIIVAEIDEVMPHPNADRLVLCRLNDGQQEYVVLTGAPNLFEYKEKGPLPKPLKVAYAREGAQLYDGHQAGEVLTTLKRTRIRGVDSFSMVCSEKELGISEEHEGIILLDADAPVGKPLADYMGDAVFSINILPNMIRNACVVGVARELAAQLKQPLRKPTPRKQPFGAPIEGQVEIEITDPSLNPRFVLGLVRGVRPRQSPYLVQRRLRLAGMRPINSIVDATNYLMLELGEPLHAFDYDVLNARAKGKTPTIITRAARKGEKLTTLDGVERTLDSFTILVCDTAGPLSLAGVMGGMESEVTETTRNVLLEGATWNPINVRRTTTAQKLNSEASYRFARGIHPALAETGVRLCLEYIAAWSGGKIAAGLVDSYPAPANDPVVALSEDDVERALGISLKAKDIASLLTRLEFTCKVEAGTVYAQTPPHRLDIGEGVVGRADLLEEIMRLHGMDSIPLTRLAQALPPTHPNKGIEGEERLRDLLARLGLQEVITYRMSSPEREARLTPPGLPAPELDYVRIQNPLTPERSVMRRSLVASVLDILEKNIRLRERLALFEIGPVFLPRKGVNLPDEPQHLAITLSGLQESGTWDRKSQVPMDFYDLKGILQALLDELHIKDASYVPVEGATIFHPGKCARVFVGEERLGIFGELHPVIRERYDFNGANVLVADFDIEALLRHASAIYAITPVPVFPPVLEDLALVVDEDLAAGRVEEAIRAAGGKLLVDVHLFDLFRGEQIGANKKSLAYALTYQAPDHTLTEPEIKAVRARIIKKLEQELDAHLRS